MMLWRMKVTGVTMAIVSVLSLLITSQTFIFERRIITRQTNVREADQEPSTAPNTYNEFAYCRTPRTNRTLNMIVELRGELGNHLSVLSAAKTTQLLASQYTNIQFRIVGQHQDHAKWTRARNDLQRCFPNFRDFDFEGGIWAPEFQKVSVAQEQWLGKNAFVVDNVQKRPYHVLHDVCRALIAGPPQLNETTSYTLPFVTVVFKANSWVVGLEDETYYEGIREFFRFNETRCCPSRTPLPNETVYHYRNFAWELRHIVAADHFVEATPETAVGSILNPNETDSVAIVSRFSNGLGSFVERFAEHNIPTRIVDGHTGVEDFCFLLKTKQEIVASYTSTFAKWAAFLGVAERNRFYFMDLGRNTTRANRDRTIWQSQRLFKTETFSQTPMTEPS